MDVRHVLADFSVRVPVSTKALSLLLSNLRKVTKKLEREGKDVRFGDKANATVTSASLTITDPASGDASVFPVKCAHVLHTYTHTYSHIHILSHT